MLYVTIGARCLLGGVFLLSVVSKVRGAAAFEAFVVSVRSMTAAPGDRARLLAGVVVAAEAVVSVLLLVPVPGPRALGPAAAAGLLCVFTAAIVSALRRGVRTPCRCFGAASAPTGWRHVVRNTALVCVSVVAAAGTPAFGRAHPAGTVTAVASGIVAALLVAALDDVAALFGAGPRPATTTGSVRGTITGGGRGATTGSARGTTAGPGPGTTTGTVRRAPHIPATRQVPAPSRTSATVRTPADHTERQP
ncbi:MauE/DoxX family redox-associated membrane protein [Streptomyces sp. NPDC006012]|uniref:MauE/DoxX family redox-associated membrane protein n=1 Tax=Streptomyces sp. NPDC006012 TaxID=3364739 RepID=UPI00369A3467